MEFVTWIEYLDQDMNGFHRQDYFLAQIAYLLATSNAKNPKSIDFNSFLMKFGRKADERVQVTSPEAARLKMIQSRSVWASTLGVDIPMDDLREDLPDVLKGPWSED